jgi:hypothetical protein
MSGGTGRMWPLDSDGNVIGEGQPFEFTGLTVTPYFPHPATTPAEITQSDHVMVVLNGGPVRIGDGPTIETRGDGICCWAMEDGGPAEVIVNGVNLVHVESPWPLPSPIPETPYEAYAHAAFPTGQFAIRLREES